MRKIRQVVAGLLTGLGMIQQGGFGVVAGGMMGGGMPPRMGMRPPGPPGPPGPYNMQFRPGPGMQGPPQMRGGY